jgi:uncharacterized membrane protein
MKTRNQYQIVRVVIGVLLAVGLLSGVIITPAAATNENVGGDTEMRISAHFAQTETDSNETSASDGNDSTPTETSSATNNTTHGSRPANASLSIDENETTPSRVGLHSVALPANGFIVVHNGSYSPESPQANSIIGRTQYVRGGNFTEVNVDLYNISGREFNRPQITKTQRIHVLVYNDSDGSRTFEPTEDKPYRNSSGYPIADSTVIEGTQAEPTQTTEDVPPESASLNINENQSMSSQVILESAALPANGFIVVHNGSYSPESPQANSIIGRTQYVRGGNYTNVTVDLYNVSGREFNRSQITKTQRIHVLVYNDSDSSRAFEPTEDKPYRNNSGYPIADSAVIEEIDTGRLLTEAVSPTPQPSPSSPPTTVPPPNQTSPEQTPRQANSSQGNSEPPNSGPGFWRTAVSAILIILGGVIVYRGLQ